MPNQEITKLKNLTLTNAILATTASVPFIGSFVMNKGMFIVLIVMAIIILTKDKTTEVSKVPNYIVLVASGLSVVVTLLVVFTLGGFSVLDSHSTSEMSGSIAVGLIAMGIVGFIAWGCYVAAAIMYWMNFSKLTKMTEVNPANAYTWQQNNQPNGQQTWPQNNQQNTPQPPQQNNEPNNQ